MINGQIDSALNRQGHMDALMVVDAGFPCPDQVELIDIALSQGVPRVLDVLAELRKVHSVEKIVMARETREHNPTHFDKVAKSFGDNVAVEVIPHSEFKTRSRDVKTIIRTGDFTAYANVLLISGTDGRWYLEKPSPRKKKK